MISSRQGRRGCGDSVHRVVSRTVAGVASLLPTRRVVFLGYLSELSISVMLPSFRTTHDHSGNVSGRHSGESVGYRPGEVTMEVKCGRGRLRKPVSEKVALR